MGAEFRIGEDTKNVFLEKVISELQKLERYLSPVEIGGEQYSGLLCVLQVVQ